MAEGDQTRPALPEITTARLRLRDRHADDAEALFPTFSDAELLRYWSRPPHTDIEQLRDELIEKEGGNWRRWTVTRIGDDRALGFVAAGEKRQGGVSELGYILAREAQGQGIAREALGALIGHLFGEGQRRVFADTDPENAASIALLEKLGFTLEGRLRSEWETHIGVRDSLIYGLLAEEWQA